MNLFDYEGKEFDKKLDEIFKNKDKEELKQELIECGLKAGVEMEEAIKVLEHLINDLKKRRENPYAVVNENFVGWDGVFIEADYVINSLENIIKRYKELEIENKTLKAHKNGCPVLPTTGVECEFKKDLEKLQEGNDK